MQITIAKRFCGPPSSGNGGYTCGRIAALIDGPAEITLRAPPPLDTPLAMERDGAAVRLRHGDQLVGEGRPAPAFALDVPTPPSQEEAVAAGRRYNGFRDHVYDTCFVCGPKRRPGDGLCIYCGPWKNGQVAGTWTPDASLDDGHGHVAPEYLWSAIDCPGSWSVIGRDDAEAPVKALPSSMLLGRLTGRLHGALRIGEESRVLGWFIGAEGRKYHVGTAVFSQDGRLLAESLGTWIALKSG